MNLTLRHVLIYSAISFFIVIFFLNATVFNEQNGGGPTTTLSHTNDIPGSSANCSENFPDIRSIGVLSDGAWLAKVASDSPWLHLISGAEGYKDGFVQYQIEPNLTDFSRAGVISIGDQKFVLVQDGYDATAPCPIQINKSQFYASSGKEATEFSLNDSEGSQEWKAEVKENNWMEFNPASGNGSGTTVLLVKANSSVSARMGVVEIAGKKIPVIQKGFLNE